MSDDAAKADILTARRVNASPLCDRFLPAFAFCRIKRIVESIESSQMRLLRLPVLSELQHLDTKLK